MSDSRVHAVRYFAYGSNLLFARMAQRVEASERPRAAQLADFTVRWHKRSRDGSGKCDIVPSPGGLVHGAVYALDETQLAALDAIEGVGQGYRRDASLSVTCEGRVIAVVTYRAEEGFVDPSLHPFDWYHDIVVAGAREVGLPAAYVESLERQPFVRDRDAARRSKERAILDRVGAPDGQATRVGPASESMRRTPKRTDHG